MNQETNIGTGACYLGLRGRKENEDARKLCKGEIQYMFSSSNFIGTTESKRMRYEGHATSRGVLLGNLKEIDQLEVPGVDGRRILKLILKKENGNSWNVFIRIRTGRNGRMLLKR
jgi:hypothetical protein